MTTYKVYICDDHMLFLESIEAYINLQEKYELIGRADNIEDAWRDIQNIHPDIILIDYHLKSRNGLDLLELIRKADMHNTCFMLTMRRDVNIRNKAKEMGANGYLLKSIGAEDMIGIFELFTSERTEFYDSLANENSSKGVFAEKRLSTRELEIAKLVCKEYSSEAIATMLNLSLHTVSTHRKNILKKMKVKNSIDLLMTLKETYGIE